MFFPYLWNAIFLDLSCNQEHIRQKISVEIGVVGNMEISKFGAPICIKHDELTTHGDSLRFTQRQNLHNFHSDTYVHLCCTLEVDMNGSKRKRELCLINRVSTSSQDVTMNGVASFLSVPTFHRSL